MPADKAPQNVDFRGCSVGTSPKAMNQIRGVLGAKSVLAGNCYAVIQNTTPVKIGGKEITQASDVTEENRPEFEKLRKRTVNKLVPAKKCILNNSDKGYFAMGGKYVALWFNTSLSAEWKKDESICYNEINPQTVDPNQAPAASKGCRLVVGRATRARGNETSGLTTGGRRRHAKAQVASYHWAVAVDVECAAGDAGP